MKLLKAISKTQRLEGSKTALIILLMLCSNANAASIRLAWDPPPEYFLAGYHVYRAEVSGGPYVRLTADPVSGTEYSDETALPGHRYFYVVTAVNSDNRESAYSGEVSVTLGKYDAAPEPGALIARTGPDLSVRMEDLVILTGNHRDPEEQNVSYRWAQVSGPSVSLSGVDKPEAAFIAPTVATDTILTFSLTVTDSAGGSTTDFISVTIHRI